MPSGHCGEATRRQCAHHKGSALAGERSHGGAGPARLPLTALVRSVAARETEKRRKREREEMKQGFRRETVVGGFCSAESAGEPSDSIRRPEALVAAPGQKWPRREGAFPAQAQVAAWVAGRWRRQHFGPGDCGPQAGCRFGPQAE